jgi:hypothetical protein
VSQARDDIDIGQRHAGTLASSTATISGPA